MIKQEAAEDLSNLLYINLWYRTKQDILTLNINLLIQILVFA